MMRRYVFLAALALSAALPSAWASAQEDEESEEADPVDALYQKAMMAVMAGDVASARRHSRDLSALASRYPKSSQEAQMAQAVVLMVATMSGDAQTLVKTAPAYDADRPADEAGAIGVGMLSKVQILRGTGKVDEAITLLRSFEPKLRTVEDKTNYHGEMGELLALKRDFAGAASSFGKAEEITRTLAEPNEEASLLFRAKRALNLQRAGRSPEAGKMFDEIFARANILLANKLKELSALPGGGPGMNEMIEKMRAAAGAGYSELSATFEVAGRAAQVMPWRQSERKATEGMANPYFRAMSDLSLIGNLLLQPGKEREALTGARQLAGKIRSLGIANHQDRAMRRIGQMQRDTLAPFLVTLADADHAYARVRPAEAEAVRAEAFAALQDASSGPASRALLAAAADRQAGAQAVKRRGLAAQWDQLEVQIASAYMTADGSRAEGLVKRQLAIESQLDLVDKEIARTAPDYYAILDPSPLTQVEARSLLRPDEAILIIVPGPRGTQVMLVTAQATAWHKAAIDETDLTNAVSTLRKSLDPRARPASAQGAWAFDRQTAHRLYRELIAPLAASLSDKKQIFAVTSGALSMLPLAILVTETPKGSDADPVALRATRWFADSAAISQLPSLQTLKSLRNRTAAGRSSRQALLGFGDPVLSGRAAVRGSADDVRGVSPDDLFAPKAGPDGSVPAAAGDVANIALLRRLARLPGTANELTRLGALIGSGRSQLFLQAKATETMVKRSNLSNLRILAFATHGLLGGAAGMDDPGLVLTPPQRATSEDDGLLTASEVIALNMGVDFAILSACDTAGGTEVISMSLARAFLAGGAETLLVSHWPVFDAVASELTTRLFSGLQTDAGLTRAAALQRAMRDVRNMPDHPEFAHPGYWAPFILVGDGARQ